MLENIRNWIKREIIENCDIDEIVKQQSKVKLIGFHKSYTNCSCYTFKHDEVVLDKPRNVGLAI